MVVSYQVLRGAFIPGTPRLWSSHTLADTGVFPNFDLGPGADEILALMPAKDTQSANHVTVLLNVGEEIRRRADAR
jgi:hypothetical protein